MTAINNCKCARCSGVTGPERLECETCNALTACNFDRTIDLWLCGECLEDEVSEMVLTPLADGEMQSLPAPVRP
jgi:hypothetical protein